MTSSNYRTSNETLTRRLIDIKNDLRKEIARCAELKSTEENEFKLIQPMKSSEANEIDNSENEDDDDFIDVIDKEGYFFISNM